ncbi:transporter substrate-binding domain-containing protein [Allosaccharopolyspora coralli]|uniref:Transporter substrate-binding domain-containing protein n=1 Tax=Allosaccharopolyspora coralli TaxID=2665642 RepID=A0A5Q3QEP6_9PSEU|nr:basic amino acid ABC transporter substrate-binding protein [Allosaccharopolyspora coralli]QGK71846.1 transporter substrate-binding domain-containing protein [Allosaccharopolyspora coralli]
MARRTTTRAVALIPALALATAVAGCGGGGGEAQGVPIVNEGTLTTCTHLPYEPFQFRDGREIVGFDVDLGKAIARDLGVEQQIIDTPFETIQSGQDLNAGKCDMAAAGMTINEVREENFDFSDPYFDATQALLVPKGSGIAGFEQLRGKRLGIQNATTGAEYAEANAKPAGVELVGFEDLGLLLEALKTQQIDAVINDNGVLYDYVKRNPELEVSTEFDTGEQYGIGVRTGNTQMREFINQSLQKLKESGEYDKLYQKWFDKLPDEN